MAEAPIVSDVPEPIAVIQSSPSDDEVVAIMAAMEVLWPRPVVVADDASGRSTAWRFSGRWWARPIAVRRDRPFR